MQNFAPADHLHLQIVYFTLSCSVRLSPPSSLLPSFFFPALLLFATLLQTQTHSHTPSRTLYISPRSLLTYLSPLIILYFLSSSCPFSSLGPTGIRWLVLCFPTKQPLRHIRTYVRTLNRRQ